MNKLIRTALDKIGAKYTGAERAWLLEKNPIVVTQLDAMQERIDAAAVAGDDAETGRIINVWVQTWLFWIQNYKVQTRKA